MAEEGKWVVGNVEKRVEVVVTVVGDGWEGKIN